MRKVAVLLAIAAMYILGCQPVGEKPTESISFYKVPLVCGAAPEIGCGSRIKPMFIATEKEKAVKESWTNREGTVIAIVWNDTGAASRQKVQDLFIANDIDAELITDTSIIKEQRASFRDSGRWYKGMDVDKLSIEEAGVIARKTTSFALKEGYVDSNEAVKIKKDIESYFKNELVQVRTLDNLTSDTTQERWKKDLYKVVVGYIGVERADKLSKAYETRLSEIKSCD